MFFRTSTFINFYDTVDRESEDWYQGEYVNSIALKGMSPHCPTLNKGALIMLLWNLEYNIRLNFIYGEVLGEKELK